MTDAPTAARDQPLIAIDVVPMSFTASDGLRVATARRRYEPAAGHEALPGVLLDGAELLADGARRALRTKTGIDAAAVRHLAQIGAFDGPDRDPRSAAISIAFLVVVDLGVDVGVDMNVSVDVDVDGLGAARPIWHGVAPDPQLGLPFDHDRIVVAALEHTRIRLWSDLPLTRALLGDPFTTVDAARLRTALTGTAPDPGNLNRMLRTNPSLARADVDAPAAGSRGGRPPAAWTWLD